MHKNLFINLSIITVLILFSVSGVFAVTQYKIDIEPKEFVLPNLDEIAEFKLMIENLDTESVHFRMSQIDPHWIIRTDPLNYWTSGITIDARSRKYINLYVSTSGLDTGYHGITLEVSPKDEQVKKELTFYVSIPEPSSRIYQPAIHTEVSVEENQDPREPIKVSVHLKNQNPLDVKKLRVIVRSDSEDGIILFNNEEITSLAPNGESGDEKEIVFSANVDDRMKPKSDIIRVTLFYNDEIVEPTIPSDEINIIGYSKIIAEEDLEKSFLKKISTYSYFDDGNIRNSDTIAIETGWFKNMFTSTSENVIFVKNDTGRYYVYDFSLEPDESVSFWISTSYRIPVAVILIIILIILAYFVFRSPLLVYKEIKEVHKTRDGMSDVKIQLHIKNRSAMTLEDIRVVDKVPSIAGLDKIFHVGTLEPTKISEHEKSGTVIRWEVDEIERFEERLFVYKIKTKLAVLGGFNLPPVVVRFKTQRGEIRRIKSKMTPVNI